MGISYDRSRWAVVVVCSDCGWQDLGVTQDAAWTLAADHEARVHPDQRTVRRAADERARYRKNSSDPEP
jgi:hypothetical protein